MSVTINTIFGGEGLMSSELPDRYYKLIRELLSHAQITKVHIFAPRSQILVRWEDSVQMFIYIDMAHGQKDGSYFDFYDILKGWVLTQVSREGQVVQIELWQKVSV